MNLNLSLTKKVWASVFTFDEISLSDLFKRIDIRNPSGRLTLSLFDGSYTYYFPELNFRSLPKGKYNVTVVEIFNCFTFSQIDVIAEIVTEETATLDKVWRGTRSVLFPDD